MTAAVLVASIAALATACIPPPEETTPEVVVTAPTLTVTYGGEIPELSPGYGSVTPTVEATCTTTASQGSPAGEYPTTCSGAERSGHTIRYVAGTVTIAPAEVTVTASDGSMDVGGSVPAITATYDGLVGITEPAVLATCSTEATAASDAGSYASSCEGASDPNHSFTYLDGTVTVGAVPVVVTAPSLVTVYGADTPELQPSYSGLVNGDTAPATTPVCSTDATPASDVGTYTTTCEGAADPNYTFTYVAGNVWVIPAPATVIASSASVAFGDEVPPITASYSGLVNGDTEPANPPICSTTAAQGSPSGTYGSTCVAASDPNYSFTYIDGTITIVAGTAPVTLTASSATMTYGDEVPATTPSYDGFTGGQTEPVTAPTCSTTATSSSPVGTYPTTCVGAADPNHVITVVNGSVTVLPAAATVTASSVSSAYGAATAAVTPTYSGLRNGDTAAATAPVCTTDATSTSPAASYTTSCAGAADPNYTFTVVDGAYTVTPAAATVTASSATITEGDDIPEITATYGGLVNGDVAPVVAATCSTTATSASEPGTYPTTCAGAIDPNYTFSSVDGTLTVEAAAEPEPEVDFTGHAAYPTSILTTKVAAGTNGGGATLPRGTILVEGASSAGFPEWVNLTVESSNGPQSVFCNGRSTTSFTTCTGGSGTTPTGAHVSNVPPNQFDVYSISGGKANVSPSSLTILADVPETARAMPSRVNATADNGLITYVQSAGATGTFSLRYGICSAGTATYSAADPNCSIGEIVYSPGSIARMGNAVTVSIVTTNVYNNFPIAVTAPDHVDQGDTFTLRWAPAAGAIPARQSSSGITATVTYSGIMTSIIPIPAGMTYQSARLVGGDVNTDAATVAYCTASGGACDANLTGNYDGTTLPYVKVTLPSVTIPGGQTFTMPTLELDLVASGAPGTSSGFALTQYRNVTRANAGIFGNQDANFVGYPTTNATSGTPPKAPPAILKSVTID